MFGKRPVMQEDPDIANVLQDIPDQEMGGQADNIPAQVSEGEYIIPADVVAALGDGSNEAGADKLDMLVQQIRAHKMQNGQDLPPPAMDPTDYMGEPLPDLDRHMN